MRRGTSSVIVSMASWLQRGVSSEASAHSQPIASRRLSRSLTRMTSSVCSIIVVSHVCKNVGDVLISLPDQRIVLEIIDLAEFSDKGIIGVNEFVQIFTPEQDSLAHL